MNPGVQRLDASIHHFRYFSDIGDVDHLESRLAQQLGCAAGRNELDAASAQGSRKIDEPRLVADRKERAGNLLHGRMSREQPFVNRPYHELAHWAKPDGGQLEAMQA